MSIFSGFTTIRKDVGVLVKNTGILNLNLNIHTMRPLQQDIYDLKYTRYLKLSMPPGAGKSASIKFPVRELLDENPNLKIVITVPYVVLTKSFGNIILQYPDGKQLSWELDLNLCESINVDDGKVEILNNFLMRKTNLISRVAIVTHRTLALVNERYPDNKYTDIMFVIDEAHHVLYPDNENKNENETSNKLGGLIKNVFNQDYPTNKIWFLTATFFRGDKYAIIPPEMAEQIFSYHLPLDEYWNKYLQYIETFEYNFVIYKNVFSEVKEIFKTQGKRKTIIYCPYNGYMTNGLSKYEFRDRLVKVIKKVWPECKILDLVQVEGRDDVKGIIIDSSNDFDVVLAVKLFDEGTDWEQAESIIDLAPSNSLRIQVQRFGRIIRDIPGKTHVIYNIFLPYKADFKDDEERRRHMSMCFNAFVASCLLHDAIKPVSKPKIKNKVVENKTTSRDDSFVEVDPLTHVTKDEVHKQQILTEVLIDLGKLKDILEEPTIEQIKSCIINTLKKNSINDESEDLLVHIVKRFRTFINSSKQHTQSKGPLWKEQTEDVSFMLEAGFDKVWSNEIFDQILVLGTSFCGIKDFKEFRKVYSSYHSLDEGIMIVNHLTKNNGGTLPSFKWLFENGYSWVMHFLNHYPEMFSHITQDCLRRALDEALKAAEELAAGNGGILPSAKILRENGYGWVVDFILRNPEKFSHINREYLVKTVDEAVRIAEELAAGNGGKLQTYTWLKKNGYRWVINSMVRCPDRFSHIKREYIKTNDKNLNEAVIIAEELAAGNGGKLQSIVWLKKNGYWWLTGFIHRYPNSFSHIKQIRLKKRRLDEAVRISEKLAAGNGGKLQSATWLNKNGYKWIVRYITRNPDRFSHIEREYLSGKSRKKSNASLKTT